VAGPLSALVHRDLDWMALHFVVLGTIMDKRLPKAVAITSGLTVVGAIMGIPTHNVHSWYQSVANDLAPTLWGAVLGFIIGLVLSLALVR
jgi:hypothetical protein